MTEIEKMYALRDELIKASDDYYNGMESMSNFEYDKKFDELKALEEQYGDSDNFTDKVGSSVSENSKLSKVTHEYEAKSLGKTKDIDELLSNQSDPNHSNVCLSWKLDGCTVQLTYDKGKLQLASTRGDGKTGSDITDNAKFIEGIPQTIDYKGKLVVRGEALISYAEFERLNTNSDYANPRNLASATVTVLDKDIIKNRKVEFKAFELVDNKPYEYTDKYGNKVEENLNWLNSFNARLDYLRDKFNFGVVEHQRLNVKDLKKGIEDWSKEDKIKALGYPVDGLVIANDDTKFCENLKGTEHHPNLMKGMAFKWKDETVETTLREIEWSASRTGLLNPVAVFDTVDLCGTKVSRASLHNLSIVENMNLQVGDKISVYKANMIIPQLAENLDKDNHKKIEYHGLECPCCKKTAVVNDNNGIKTLNCENEDCSAKQIGKFSHFVEKHGMNIDGLSENTLQFMLDNDYIKRLEDLYTLKDDPFKITRLKEEEGFGEKSVNNMLKAIKDSTKTDFVSFVYAIGIDGIGKGQAKVIKNFIDENVNNGNLDKYVDSSKDTKVYLVNTSIHKGYLDILTEMIKDGYDFTNIEGIGSVLANNLTTFISDKFIETENLDRNDKRCEIKNLLDYITIEPIKEKDLSLDTIDLNNSVNGKTFVITGTLINYPNRDALVSDIESNGGKVSGSVSSKTDYLINNDVTSTSGKNKKAKDLGIPIISENDYENLKGDNIDKSKNNIQIDR